MILTPEQQQTLLVASAPLRRCCGIYSIVNTVNGKRYYGSSLNVKARKNQHIHTLRKGTHRNKHLQAAWRLYGESSFVFELVKEAAAADLQSVEQPYLDVNTDGYNVSKCAECAPRGLKWSDESKKKLSVALRGRKFSDEHKKALSIAGMGRRMTDAQKATISERMSGRTVSATTNDKIATTIRSIWQNPEHRQRIIASQYRGNATVKAKKNRSAASFAMWRNPDYTVKMRESRMRLWSNPEYRMKMCEIRRSQGESLRQKNKQRKAKYALC